MVPGIEIGIEFSKKIKDQAYRLENRTLMKWALREIHMCVCLCVFVCNEMNRIIIIMVLVLFL